jgi:hypothetical protein
LPMVEGRRGAVPPGTRRRRVAALRHSR